MKLINKILYNIWAYIVLFIGAILALWARDRRKLEDAKFEIELNKANNFLIESSIELDKLKAKTIDEHERYAKAKEHYEKVKSRYVTNNNNDNIIE